MNGQIMKGIVASLVVLALSACGGGGGGSTTSAPAAPVAKKPVQIDAEGDSTMWGAHGGGTQSQNPAPVVLQGLLQAKLGSSVIVVNNGVAGTTVQQDVLGYAPKNELPLATKLASNTSQIVLENFGINDANSETSDQFKVDLERWVSTVRAMGKIPVMEEPNPVTFSGLPNVAAAVPVIQQVAAEQNVPLIKQYDYILSLPNWQAMLVDGVHPNDALYAIKAQREYDVIAPIVAGMQ